MPHTLLPLLVLKDDMFKERLVNLSSLDIELRLTQPSQAEDHLGRESLFNLRNLAQ